MFTLRVAFSHQKPKRCFVKFWLSPDSVSFCNLCNVREGPGSGGVERVFFTLLYLSALVLKSFVTENTGQSGPTFLTGYYMLSVFNALRIDLSAIMAVLVKHDAVDTCTRYRPSVQASPTRTS